MRNKKGFTLVEVMLVVAVIAVLAAAIAIPRFIMSINDAKTSACNANIANMNSQWEIKQVKTGAYGTLAALLGDVAYFPDGAPTCPYATAYADANADSRVDAHAH